MQIQGGEPFLYPDLGELIEALVKMNCIEMISIATNGMVTPGEELLKVIKKHDVLIRVSSYKVSEIRAKQLMEKCDGLGIRTRIYTFVGENAEWNYTGGIDVKREENDSVVAERFYACLFKDCLTLERGELSHCSRACNAYYIQGFERTAGDYVLVKNRNLERDMDEYLENASFMTACRYCYGTSSGIMCKAGEQQA